MSVNDSPRSNGHESTDTKAKTGVTLVQDGQPREAGEHAILSVETTERGPQIHVDSEHGESFTVEIDSNEITHVTGGMIQASQE